MPNVFLQPDRPKGGHFAIRHQRCARMNARSDETCRKFLSEKTNLWSLSAGVNIQLNCLGHTHKEAKDSAAEFDSAQVFLCDGQDEGLKLFGGVIAYLFPDDTADVELGDRF